MLNSMKFDISTYNEFKTELEICRFGGLFIALYKERKIIDLVIGRLKHDLPEYFIFSLQMTPQKISFPTFFEQTFEETGGANDIFHVIGIEGLSEELQVNFINYLQYNRERFKTKPYSIIFWTTPSFEKKLFFNAPDFYHWISGVYDFSKLETANSHPIKVKSPVSPPRIPLQNITGYLKKVVWQYENWTHVKNEGEEFLIDAMARSDLHEYYVKTYCITHEDKTKLLDEVFEGFLENADRHFLTLLGDFGTGKTSFSLHYFIQLAKKFIESSKNRIPIFISLKNYPKEIVIKDFIVKEFYDKYKIAISFDVFQALAIEGMFVFFIDGFDEMMEVSDRALTERNFRELTKLTFEKMRFLTESCERISNANKVFLTCRTHYFFTEVHEKKTLKSSYTVLYRDYATKTDYEITKITLKEFNDKQIKEYVLKNTRNAVLTESILREITYTYNLRELSERPILLDIIIKTLPSLEDRIEINASDLYGMYTEMWIGRDDWRSQMLPEGKRKFMWELALKMFKKGGDFSIHYSALAEPNEIYLKKDFQYQKSDSDYYRYETTTCTFLNRDSRGNYKFIHKSFMEYFIAELIFYCITNKEQFDVPYEKLNREIMFFLKLIISSKRFNLQNFDLNHLDLSGINLERAKLTTAKLQNSKLKGADLHGANLKSANLSGADLSGADLSGADLSWAKIEDALFISANLQGALFIGAKLRNTDFSFSDIYRADFRYADRKGAKFKRKPVDSYQ